MLNYDRTDVSEGADVNKTSASKECDICHYWYFLNYSFKFQPNICNRCHDILMMSINLSDIAILNVYALEKFPHTVWKSTEWIKVYRPVKRLRTG